MRHLSKKHKAFTLLEMAISLIVISIIIVGVLNATGLVDSSRLAVARSLTARAPVKNIDGLVAWYETTSFDSFDKAEASEGATINNWYDINPESIPSQKNTLVKKTGTVSYVRDGINGVPALNFSSADDISVSTLQLAGFAQGSTVQNTLFIVFKQLNKNNGNAIRSIIDNAPSEDDARIGYQSSTGKIVMKASTEVFSGETNIASFEDNSSYIYAAYFDRGNSKGYINNISTVVGGGNINPGDNALVGLTIGSTKGDDNDSRFVGLIGEIIIYNRILKRQERKGIMTYLSQKYDITIGS